MLYQYIKQLNISYLNKKINSENYYISLNYGMLTKYQVINPGVAPGFYKEN